MKKWLAVMLGVLFVTPVFAGNWGVSAKLGIGENDPKGMKEAYNATPLAADKTESGVYGGLEAFYEIPLADETNKLGLKLGFDGYGENELNVYSNAGKLTITENTAAIPLTIYYRKDNGIKAWSFFGGAGVTFLFSELKADGWGLDDENTHKNKVFPHVTAGVEYRFTKLFALGLDARYNFDAKLKKEGTVLADRSGFGAALTGRFYF